jgi:hypothetical protein
MHSEFLMKVLEVRNKFGSRKRKWDPRGSTKSFTLFTSALGGEGSASRPGRFTPGKTRYPLYRRLGGPQDRSG